jgi:hypothetical protein
VEGIEDQQKTRRKRRKRDREGKVSISMSPGENWGEGNLEKLESWGVPAMTPTFFFFPPEWFGSCPISGGADSSSPL